MDDATPVLLDVDEEVSLDMGESAFVKARSASPLASGSDPDGLLTIETNFMAPVHTMTGVWDRGEGLVLICNFSQPSVTPSFLGT